MIIAFTVDDTAQHVMILGVFYGGQDYESAFTQPTSNPPPSAGDSLR